MIAPPRSRNDPCPCGSGKRYKHCHGSEEPSPPAAAPAPADLPDSAGDPLEAARSALRAGRHARAADVIVRHFGDAPADLAALKLLAEALRPSDPVRSRAHWEAAHRAAPDDPESLFFLGDFCREAGEARRAVELFERALAMAPDHPGLLNNLGLALEKDGRVADAEPRYRRALEVEPDSLNALANLAQNLYQQHRAKDALPLFDQVIARMPAPPAAIWANRAVCFRLCGESAKAEASLERAAELLPDSIEIWRNLGIARIEQRKFGAAALALVRAVALDPEDNFARSMLLHSNCYECVWRGYDDERARVVEGAARPASPKHGRVVPFVLMSVADDPAVERAVAVRWAASDILPAAPKRPPRRAADGRINLGFVSTDFHEHPVGRLVVGLFERLDRARFRVHAYSPGLQIEDPVRARLASAADAFRAFPVIDSWAVADAMRADGIDVAFDLTGYTGAPIADVFAHRPAPVQVNFLGFTGTMGSAAFDWILTDRYCVPPASAAHFVERPLYVDPCYLPSDVSRAPDPSPLTRRAYGLPDDGAVFAAQMAAYKILPPTFDAWLEILRRVEGSVLWLREQSTGMAARLREHTKSRGVDPSRIVFARPETIPRYLARFRLADLFLDTVPFGAHTTVNDALFVGLPAITCAGHTFAARASASQVRAAGLADLVVDDLDGYVRTAVSLARDRASLGAITSGLRERRASLPLFDLEGYARSFEAAIERAWAETPAD